MTAARPQLDQPALAEAQHIVSAVAGAFSAEDRRAAPSAESMLIGCSPEVTSSSRASGLAKTTAARVVAESVGGAFKRIQVHAGSAAQATSSAPRSTSGDQLVRHPARSRARQHRASREINRSSAKTQSAMLEAMEERQTTIAGVEYPIPDRSS